MKPQFIQYGFRVWAGMVLLTGALSPVAAQTISTVAGDGTAAIGAAGTGGSNSVAIDAAGNIYVSAGGLNIIRKITPSNTVTTFAGTGAAGYSGDNGPATSATFKNIQDLYFAAGSLYIADGGNRRIRKIDLGTNIVTTVAGDGTTAVTGNGIGGTTAVAVDGSGNIYVAGGGIPVIRKITPANVHSTFAGTGTSGYSGDNAIATAATLNLPSDLFVSNGKLYIADSRNRRIRSIDLTSNIISTVAGDGSSNITGNGIGAATGVAVDASGAIFVATGNAGNAVRKISGGTYTTLSGGTATGGFSGDNGAPAAAALNLPADLYLSGTDLFVADQKNRRIRKITNTVIPLPLDLVRFTATPVRSEVALQWITAMEKNTAGFDVERSADALDFETIGYVSSAGASAGKQNTVYDFIDREPLTGSSFYRLKIKDRDGAFTYSDIAAVSRFGENGIRLSPVPADQTLNLSLSNKAWEGAEAMITDLQGRAVQRLILKASIRLDIGAWAAGVYYLRLPDGSAVRFMKK